MESPVNPLPFAPSTICLGSCGFGSDIPTEDCFRLLDRYVELGGNLLDTAHCYDFWRSGGLGKPERVIGEWIRRSGASVALATKGGHPDGGPAYPRPDDFLSAQRISLDVSESLERLGIETIDLYYLHRDDGKTSVGEIVDALNAEIEAGRIRSLGASNWSVERITEANAYAKENGKVGFAAVQNQWSLGVPSWTIADDPTLRYVVDSEVPAFQGLGVTLFPYSATSNGFFGTDGRAGDAFRTDANRDRLARVQTLASQLGVSPNQIALAWLLNQPLPVVPIIGTKSLAHLQDAFEAAEVPLSSDRLAWLRG
ncbi:aldo/keto reductase [bacterium]|nr:MAG: aldo/keto reductase [bacterium]